MDLRDIGGRLWRFVASVLLAGPISVGVMLALASIITDEHTGATTWFAFSVTGMVFVPLAFAINAILTSVMRPRPAPLPRARLVRR